MLCIISTIAYSVFSALAIILMTRETNRRLMHNPPDDIDAEKVKPYKMSTATVLLAAMLTALAAWCGFAVSSYPEISVFAVIKIGMCCVAALAAAVIDLKLRIIPNYISLTLIVGRVILAIFEFIFTNDALGYLISSLIGGSACILLLIIANKISKGGIGGGDIKLLTCIGFVCGLQEVVTTMLLAVVVCIIVSVVLLLLKKLTTKDHLPFGPFIYLGFMLMSLLAVY